MPTNQDKFRSVVTLLDERNSLPRSGFLPAGSYTVNADGSVTIGSGVGSLLVYKTATTTRNTVVVTPDPHLVFSNVAAGTYALEAYLRNTQTAGGGFNCGINVTPGPVDANSFAGGIGGTPLNANAITVTIGTGVGTTSFVNQGNWWVFGTLLTIAAISTVSVQWAQNAAMGDTNLIIGSWFKLTRMA